MINIRHISVSEEIYSILVRLKRSLPGKKASMNSAILTLYKHYIGHKDSTDTLAKEFRRIAIRAHLADLAEILPAKLDDDDIQVVIMAMEKEYSRIIALILNKHPSLRGVFLQPMEAVE